MNGLLPNSAIENDERRVSVAKLARKDTDG